MLFAITWRMRHATEEGEKRTIQLFTNWKPPAGVEFKAFYDFADGSGGIAIAEVASPAAMLEAIAPWTPYLRFKTSPVIEPSESTPIFQRVAAWRDSVR